MALGWSGHACKLCQLLFGGESFTRNQPQGALTCWELSSHPAKQQHFRFSCPRPAEHLQAFGEQGCI